MALALRDLAAAPGPRFALLADMLELGPEGPAFHQGLLPGLAALDGVFLVGPLMSALAAPLGPRCLGAWPTLAELELEPILRVLTPGQMNFPHFDEALLGFRHKHFLLHFLDCVGVS